MSEKKTELEKVIRSPSQRLRSVLYLIWQQEQAEIAFQKFYEEVIEKIIAEFSKKIKQKGGK